MSEEFFQLNSKEAQVKFTARSNLIKDKNVWSRLTFGFDRTSKSNLISFLILKYLKEMDGRENFETNWSDYQHGFGNKSGEFEHLFT